MSIAGENLVQINNQRVIFFAMELGAFKKIESGDDTALLQCGLTNGLVVLIDKELYKIESKLSSTF